MVTAADQFVYGTFTSDGNPVDLNLGFVPTYFKMWNKTKFDSTANPGVVKIAWWDQNDASGTGFSIVNTNGAATNQCALISSNGFFPRSGVEEQLGSALSTGGAISQANPAVVTLTGHGLSTGDVVRLYGTTGMLQVAGVDYVITVTGSNTFTIPVNSSGFSAAATAAVARQVIVPRAFAPKTQVITNITAASPAVITTANNHGYAAGEKYRLRVSSDWGMVEANDVEFTVVSVTANTITTDLNSSAFTSFSYPTSAAAAAGVTPAQVVPIGDEATVLSGATNNAAFAGIRLGSSVCGASSDVIEYFAARSAVFNS